MAQPHSSFGPRGGSVVLPGVLAAIALALSAAYIVSQVLLRGCNDTICEDVVAFFAFSSESNLPTWFSSTCWLVAAMLCLSAASTPNSAERRLRGYWVGLAVLSAFLSMDEAAMFHERFGTIMGRAMGDGGLGLYNWQSYGAVLVLAVALTFLPFLARVPKAVRNRLFLAAFLFLSGALGMESVEALFLREDAPFAGAAISDIPMVNGLQFLIEELLEMLGIIAWIHAILHYHDAEPSRVEDALVKL